MICIGKATFFFYSVLHASHMYTRNQLTKSKTEFLSIEVITKLSVIYLCKKSKCKRKT